MKIVLLVWPLRYCSRTGRLDSRSLPFFTNVHAVSLGAHVFYYNTRMKLELLEQDMTYNWLTRNLALGEVIEADG